MARIQPRPRLTNRWEIVISPADATVTPAGSLPGPVADEAIGTVGGAVYLASGLSSSSGGALRPLVQVVRLSLAPTP